MAKEARQPLAARTQQPAQTRPIATMPHRSTKPSVYSSAADRLAALEASEMDVDARASGMDFGPDSLVDFDDEATLGGMSDVEGDDLLDDDEYDEDNWLRMTEEDERVCLEEIQAVREVFQDDVDLFDTTMVAEYADEIFAHMEELEVSLPYPATRTTPLVTNETDIPRRSRRCLAQCTWSTRQKLSGECSCVPDVCTPRNVHSSILAAQADNPTQDYAYDPDRLVVASPPPLSHAP